MTCIVGMIEGPKVWMGGDAIEANGSMHAGVRADAKVFRNGPFLIGVCGTWRLNHLLRYGALAQHQQLPAVPLAEFMATEFLDSVRRVVQDGGFQPDAGGSFPCGDFLVGVAGHLFTVYSASQVAETPYGFAAVGCGSQIAKGALYALTDTDSQRPVRKQVEIALRAAAEFQADVRGPFTIEVIGE